ncbi:hypothetical protein [uncultured Cytophaga sp.]|uniref:WG repeat-containing protein n=1 Tax=uncultured Cytophaga sp. TaxID=160238 RepID=UPI002615B244|nr:hypothetical protein [uncultured Cytophaga sp.]
MNNLRYSIFIASFLRMLPLFGQTAKEDYLVIMYDSVHDACGYQNRSGDTIIPFNTFRMCYTDTFKTAAVVLKDGEGFVAIDRTMHVLYNVFPFDNGPDYISEGLYRIVKNNEIGYANAEGIICIQPQFACAYPFENGRAKVSKFCTLETIDEHTIWKSALWYYIDKNGHEIISE